ncbi:hypothetical protein OAR11_02850 [Alphaproteobacteria bacterium]|nr:hypothetical protein [Alphaproteobacteria bacterium]
MAEKETRKISDLIRERFAEPNNIGKDRLAIGTMQHSLNIALTVDSKILRLPKKPCSFYMLAPYQHPANLTCSKLRSST